MNIIFYICFYVVFFVGIMSLCLDIVYFEEFLFDVKFLVNNKSDIEWFFILIIL